MAGYTNTYCREIATTIQPEIRVVMDQSMDTLTGNWSIMDGVCY